MSLPSGLRLVLLVSLSVLVALGTTATGRSEDDDPEPFKPPRTLNDLAKLVAARGDVKRGAAVLKKQYPDLYEVEKAYKPRRRGGIGVGPAAVTDGIEMKIINLNRQVLTAAALKQDKDDLTAMAHLIVAINEVTRTFAPEDPLPGKGKKRKDWHRHADEVKKGAEGLLKAIKANDPAAVKRAAAAINNGCYNCHSDFRE